MARILITGSSDGLGLMAAQLLAGGGHAVTLHARNEDRALYVMRQANLAKLTLKRGGIIDRNEFVEGSDFNGHALGFRKSSGIGKLQTVVVREFTRGSHTFAAPEAQETCIGTCPSKLKKRNSFLDPHQRLCSTLELASRNNSEPEPPK